MLPREAIYQFMQIYKELYNEELSFEEAEIQAIRVFNAIKATYKPMEKEWLKKMRGGEK